MSASAPPSKSMVYDLLILGAGWTSEFLIPLCKERQLKYAATTTTGRDGTIRWKFDPSEDGEKSYRALPKAHTVLVTFPLVGEGQSRKLVEAYRRLHGDQASASGKGNGKDADGTHFIQLGSTGIWNVPQPDLWVTRHSPYDKSDRRAVAEDELRSLGGCVLNLSGLWGNARQPRDFVSRVAGSKEQLAGKGSLHMIHGQDVARAVLAVAADWPGPSRWMLTDTMVYDWYELVLGWGVGGSKGKDDDHTGEQLQWVLELTDEQNIRALPRSMEQLGRAYDSREFWKTFKLTPVRARI